MTCPACGMLTPISRATSAHRPVITIPPVPMEKPPPPRASTARARVRSSVGVAAMDVEERGAVMATTGETLHRQATAGRRRETRQGEGEKKRRKKKRSYGGKPDFCNHSMQSTALLKGGNMYPRFKAIPAM